MKHRCGTALIWTMWNTEDGDAEGWYCPHCDIYNAKPIDSDTNRIEEVNP